MGAPLKRFVLDLECDELLRKVTKCHIVGWMDKDTKEFEYYLEDDLRWKERLAEADVLITHNGAGYDLPVLKKLFNWVPAAHVRIQDTMLMSLVLDYNRFPQGRHSLGNWGEYLGFPKLDFNDFSVYTEEMLTYWKRDIELTDKVHDEVMQMYRTLYEKNPYIATYLKAENYVSKWCAEASLHGWPFDKERAVALLSEIGAVMDSTRNKLLPRLGSKTVAIDKKLGVVEPKKPKWIKSGAYDAHTANYFGIDPWNGVEDRLVEGPYSRIKFEDLDVNSISDVKIFLFRNGWVPTEYNTKPNPDGRGKIKTSPKVTEDSLDCLEGDGKLYCDFLTNSSRYNVLKGWISACDENNMLHGDSYTVGTPSMRMRHSIIVNVPATDSVWGPEMRSLFTVLPGWVMIGADSAGNQARGLAHYLQNAQYTDLLLNGDTHMFNADVIRDVLLEMGVSWSKYIANNKSPVSHHSLRRLVRALKKREMSWEAYFSTKRYGSKKFAKVRRGAAKRILYAFLFGASGGKMWSYIFGTQDDIRGKKLKTGFTKAVPGFKDLIDKLENIFGKTKQYGDGYIPGIAGNRIYCDSFHKLLVYLLQATEKATCGAALMLTMIRLEAEGIPYIPLIMMHDEIDFMVPEEHEERAKVISKQAFIDGPKLFGIDIMDGEAKSGKTWFDVH